jgi:hypothetical protein
MRTGCHGPAGAGTNPVTPIDDPEGVARVIANSRSWVPRDDRTIAAEAADGFQKMTLAHRGRLRSDKHSAGPHPEAGPRRALHGGEHLDASTDLDDRRHPLHEGS